MRKHIKSFQVPSWSVGLGSHLPAGPTWWGSHQSNLTEAFTWLSCTPPAKVIGTLFIQGHTMIAPHTQTISKPQPKKNAMNLQTLALNEELLKTASGVKNKYHYHYLHEHVLLLLQYYWIGITFSSTIGSTAIIVLNFARDSMFMVIHLFPCHL